MNTILESINSMGKVFVGFAWPMLVQSSLLIVVVLGLDAILRQRARAVLRYWIWMIVLVKLMLPPTLASPTSLAYWLGDELRGLAAMKSFPAGTSAPGSAVTGILPDPSRGPRSNVAASSRGNADFLPARVASAAVDGAVAPAASASLVTWQGYILLVWLASVVVMMALLIQRILFVRSLVAQSEITSDAMAGILQLACRQMHITTQVGLRLSPAIASPSVCGLVRPTILIPQNLSGKVSEQRFQAIFLHELAHIKRGDLWVSCIQTIVQIVYVYHPLLWVANAAIRKVREQAADEMVLVALGEEADDYPKALLDVSRLAFGRPALSLRFLGVAESKKALHRRIKHMLTRPVPKNASIGVLGTILILVVAAVLLPMARAEKSNQEASAAPQVTDAGAAEKAPPTNESDTIIDPKTGVKVALAKTISGTNNLIEHLNKLTLSPDGRFLLWWGRVVPLDGTEAFSSGAGHEVAVSPNGRYIAHGDEAVWVQPVSPETLRPSGPAKKLLDLKGERLVETWGRPEALHWTHDSETVFFRTWDTAGKSSQYAFSEASGARVAFPDNASRALRSPDGKCMAFTDGNPGFWVQTVGEGAARNLCGEGPAPLCWSADGRWLIAIGPGGGVVRFTQYPDGQEYLVSLPSELESSSACVGTSPDRKMLFFYQPGYELKNRVKVASASNATLKDVDVQSLANCQWTPDGKSLWTIAYTEQGEAKLLRNSLTGEEPVQVSIKLDVSGRLSTFLVSPDAKWLLFRVAPQRATGGFDLGVASLSPAQREVTGPATVAFRSERRAGGAFTWGWSPDSTRVALTSKDDPGDTEGIWVAFADGRAPLRLTQTTATERELRWSADGSTLAFISDWAGPKELRAVPAAGGETTVIRKWNADDDVDWAWSSDSKSLTIAEAGMLVRQPLSGGKAEPIANLKESGIKGVSWLSWSPDGSRLALVCDKPGNKDLRVWGQLLFARVAEGRLQPTAAVDLKGGNWNYVWSPDSEHVAYTCEDAVVVRPAGQLYALAVEDVLARISAGAIPPTRKQTATPPVEKPSKDTGTVPQAQPIVGPAFSDNFDAGPSQYWRIVDSNTERLPPPGHATENGQLMLSNSSIRLDQIDWTDYVVRVRVCMKESIVSGEAVFGIQTRTTPCAFGIKNRDRYNFVITCLDGRPTGLYLGINYRDPSNTAHNANLDRSSFTILPDKWYTLEFEVRGQHLRGSLDGKLMVEATDERLSKGGIWLGAWRSRALFDDFSVRQLP